MTEKERDQKISEIKALDIPLPVKARQIESVIDAYRDLLTFAHRNAFVHADEMDRTRYDAFDIEP